MNQCPPLHRTPLPSLEIRKECLALVIRTAEEFNIPPAFITMNNGGRTLGCRGDVIGKARNKVKAAMITELGMRHWHVAFMMNCDMRRVRASELGIPVSCYRGRAKLFLGKRRYKFHPNLMIPIGDQFCWSACVPQIIEKPKPPLMRPLSARAINGLDEDGRKALARFLQDQANRLLAVA